MVRFWINHEVLLCCIPSIGSHGCGIDENSLRDLIGDLRNENLNVSFRKWLESSQSILRWNSNCSILVWDIVCMLFLQSQRNSNGSRRKMSKIDLMHSLPLPVLVMYLTLHVRSCETPISRTQQYTHET